MLGAAVAIAAGLPSSAVAGPARWQLVGTTYNSVAFLDRGSLSMAGGAGTATVMRVSGQPASDGWQSVTQQIGVDCAARRFADKGSAIEQADGSIVRYGASGAYQPVPSRGVFLDLYEATCQNRGGTMVADPRAWTRANFRPH
jgi:hypothetical protein